MNQMAKDGAMDCIVTIIVGSLNTITLNATQVQPLCLILLLFHWVVSKMAFGIHQAVTSVEDQMAMDGVMERIATRKVTLWHGMTGIVAQ